MKNYLRSSPHFFRPVKIAFVIGVAVLLLLAWLFPAPLQEAADYGRVPNPARSAWFLLWMQELVSYSSRLIYLIAALAVIFAGLPWLPGLAAAERACWLPADQKRVNRVTLTVFVGIIALTLIAMFFRGPNWALVVPF
ncbi:MAG: cytochrome B6 [Desulfuromonadales bacterium]|nr:cytochrome B6 [Desulfuromonadales bacterium]